LSIICILVNYNSTLLIISFLFSSFLSSHSSTIFLSILINLSVKIITINKYTKSIAILVVTSTNILSKYGVNHIKNQNAKTQKNEKHQYPNISHHLHLTIFFEYSNDLVALISFNTIT